MHILGTSRHARIFFDAIAPIYDALNPLIYTEEMRRRLLGEANEGLMLDVGCGTGYTSRDVSHIGIDISEKMLARAHGVRARADAHHLPFKDGCFSTVICAGSFYYLQDPSSALRGFHRVLREEGVFLSLSPTLAILKPLVRIYEAKDYQTLFRETGFLLEKAERLRRVALLVKARKA